MSTSGDRTGTTDPTPDGLRRPRVGVRGGVLLRGLFDRVDQETSETAWTGDWKSVQDGDPTSESTLSTGLGTHRSWFEVTCVFVRDVSK